MANSLSTENYRVFVDLLKEERLTVKLSQLELAERLGKPQSYVSKVEGRERRLDVIEYCAWVQALGAEPASLLARLCEMLPTQAASRS